MSTPEFGFSITPDLDSETGDLTLTMHTHAGRTISDMSRELYRLKEDCIREALISLGWTPPPEERT